METDKLSLHRIGLLYKFYSPAIRLLLIIGGTVLLGSYAMCLYGVSMTRLYPDDGPFMLIYSMGAGIAGWVYLAGPFILAMVSNRATVTTLPASWAEKSIFIFSWIFVVYPLYLAALWYGATGVCLLFTDLASVNSVMMDMIFERTAGINFGAMTNNSMLYNSLNAMVEVSVAALVIVSVRRNRFVLGIVGLIVSSFAFWIIGMVVGVVSVLRSGFIDEVASGGSTPENFAQNIIDQISAIFPFVGAFSVLVVIVCVILAVRKIKMRQN